MRTVTSGATAAFALLFVGWSALAHERPRQNAQHAGHWGYQDAPGTVIPAHWGELPGNKVCAVGKRQSPIALANSGPDAATPSPEPVMRFGYHASKLSMINDGHTVQFNVAAGSAITEAGVSYRLVQFHFHAPSEHTLNGERFPLEIHLVHLDAAGKPALVVGIFVREGKENLALATAFHDLPASEGKPRAPAGKSIDATGILPAAPGHFAYDGSLTTPPCSEGIRWRVMLDPITMSAAQIDAYRGLPHLGYTARPLQASGGRTEVFVAAQ